MAGAFTAVDLSKLPAPNAVEQISYEAILASMVNDFKTRNPEFSAMLESDPAFKVLEVVAYREVLIRQRANEAVKAVMLAYAKDTDLDHIAANANVERLMLDAGNPNAIPPIPPTYESDESLVRRVQLSPEGFSTAGATGGYVFHALGADANVKDANATSLTAGTVEVAVLSRVGNGEASPELIEAVNATLSDEDVRPLTDNVIVKSAEIIEYDVEAELTFYKGAGSAVSMQAARNALEAFLTEAHGLGRDVTIDALHAALRQTGVYKVTVNNWSDIITDWDQAPYCTDIILIDGGVGG
jgi:phage-related baseplate assembly protein